MLVISYDVASTIKYTKITFLSINIHHRYIIFVHTYYLNYFLWGTQDSVVINLQHIDFNLVLNAPSYGTHMLGCSNTQ